MTILVTGGTGKTGSRLATLLQQAGFDVLVASRSGKPLSSNIPGLGISPIDRIYLVPPVAMDMLRWMQPFIELAIERGIKKFVLLGALSIHIGDPMIGKVHEYLAQKEPK
ncbi:hypothetical protein AX16_002007, partial [Volvariella volvacea WC 439]